MCVKEVCEGRMCEGYVCEGGRCGQRCGPGQNCPSNEYLPIFVNTFVSLEFLHYSSDQDCTTCRNNSQCYIRHCGMLLQSKLSGHVREARASLPLSPLRLVWSGSKPIPRFVLLQRGVQSNRIAAFKWVHLSPDVR